MYSMFYSLQRSVMIIDPYMSYVSLEYIGRLLMKSREKSAMLFIIKTVRFLLRPTRYVTTRYVTNKIIGYKKVIKIVIISNFEQYCRYM